MICACIRKTTAYEKAISLTRIIPIDQEKIRTFQYLINKTRENINSIIKKIDKAQIDKAQKDRLNELKLIRKKLDRRLESLESELQQYKQEF